MINTKENDINIRFKLTALWTSVTLCYLYCDYFQLYAPEKVKGLMSGQNMLDSPAKLLTAAVIMAVPACMVFLNLVLSDRLLKVLNIVFGSFFTLIMLLIIPAILKPWYAFYVFYAVLEIVITIFIVRMTWKWDINKPAKVN